MSVRTTLRRRQTQTGGGEPANQFATAHRHRPQSHGLVPHVRGEIVMVSVEPASRNLERLCEVVQLFERVVTDHVAPDVVPMLPPALVHEHRHRRSV